MNKIKITKSVNHGLLIPEIGDIFSLEENQCDKGSIVMQYKNKDQAINKKIKFDMTKSKETFSDTYFKLFTCYMTEEIKSVTINFSHKIYELIIERKAGE